MAKKKVVKKSANNDYNLEAFVTTFLSIIGFVIALIAWKENKYVMFYAKQSLMIFIVLVIGSIAGVVPVIGWIIGGVVSVVGLVLWIVSWIYALSGEMKEVPFVGKYARDFKI